MVERINGKTILTTPVSAEDLEGIKIGDIIYLNGSMTTCRDVAHRRVVEEGREIPVDVRNNAIFHAGPIIRPLENCLLYTSPSPRDRTRSRMPSSA